MDIEFLKNFMVMAECDSVSQAARKLYVAQSAMSNRLKALEKECGAELIERDHHTFRLTESGRILYERARKIVELYDATINDVRGADDGTSGTLNIAVTPSLATGVMRDALCEFNRRYPAVSVKLFEDVIKAMAGDGCTVLISGHIIAELKNVCDCAAILDGGVIKAYYDDLGAIDLEKEFLSTVSSSGDVR